MPCVSCASLRGTKRRHWAGLSSAFPAHRFLQAPGLPRSSAVGSYLLMMQPVCVSSQPMRAVSRGGERRTRISIVLPCVPPSLWFFLLCSLAFSYLLLRSNAGLRTLPGDKRNPRLRRAPPAWAPPLRQERSRCRDGADRTHDCGECEVIRAGHRGESTLIVLLHAKRRITLTSFFLFFPAAIWGQLLAHITPHGGGLLYLSLGLFHQQESIRERTVDILSELRAYPVSLNDILFHT